MIYNFQLFYHHCIICLIITWASFLISLILLGPGLAITHFSSQTPYPRELGSLIQHTTHRAYPSDAFYFDKYTLLSLKIVLDSSFIPKPFFLPADDGPPYEREFPSTLVDIDYEHTVLRSINESEFEFILLEEVYVDSFCGFAAMQKRFHYSTKYCQEYKKGLGDKLNYTGAYDLCVGVCHISSTVFGHFIIDTLQYLALIPQTFLEKAHIIFTRKMPYMKEYLSLLGISTDQILELEYDRYIFARKFLTPKTIPCNSQNLFTIQHLHKLFKNKYNMDTAKPFRHIVILRDSIRKLKNEDVFGTIKKLFPNQNWELFQRKKTLEKTAKYFNEVRLLFTEHGSAMANCIFMQKGSVICEIQMVDFNDFYVTTLIGLGIHQVAVRDQRMEQFMDSDYPVPTSHLEALIKTGLAILEKENKSI